MEQQTLAGVFVLGLLLTNQCAQPTVGALTITIQQADLVLLNGKVITVDSEDTIVEAVAVKNGRIDKLGKNEFVKTFVGPQTLVLDLKGKTVTPGLVDSHIHVMYHGRQFWEGFLNIRFPDVRSKKDLLRLVAERIKTTAKGEWISGNQGFPLSMKETPNRWELDLVSPNNPVYLRHSSGQYGAVNSYALRLAGINVDTPNPYGGVIARDPTSGDLTGILFHYPAENLIGRIATGYGQRTNSELVDDVRRGQDLSLAAGYTSGQDVIVGAPRHVWIYKRMAEDNALKMRLYLMEYIESEETASNLLATASSFKTEMLSFGGWKLAVDGGAAAGTGLMYDTSLPAANRSYLYHSQETLNRIVGMLHKAGFQVSFHAGGDRAIDMALNAIEAALKETPRENHRHRLEHVIYPTVEALGRIKRLGVVVSTQPQWISFHADGYLASTDETTMQRFMPIRTMLDMGINLAFGCDVPATIMLEPKWAFLGAVTRTTQSGYTPASKERISMKDALRIHTMGSAYASFEEDNKGSIEEGKLADMVVWSHNLYSIPTDQMRNLEAEITIVGGKIVYSKEKTTTTLGAPSTNAWASNPLRIIARAPGVQLAVSIIGLVTVALVVLTYLENRREKKPA